MTDRDHAKHLTHPGFLRNHGLSRRTALRLGAAGGLTLASGMPSRLVRPAAA